MALLLAEIVGAHLPADVFGVVLGAGATGRALADHPDVAAVSFTGSRARRAGRGGPGRPAAAAGSRPRWAGRTPSVVLADADLDRAATAIAYAAMGYAGQKCTATSRIIVEDAVYARVP